MSFDKVLRDAADDFLIVVAVCAEDQGRPPAELCIEAIQDAQARLTESGALSSVHPEDEL